MTPEDEQSPDRILKEKLIRTLIGEIPLVGKLINAMTFEVAESEASARSKAKLQETLNAIQHQQLVQNTDLGDLLVGVGQQTQLTQQMRDALLLLAAYVQGHATPQAAIVVEQAAVKALPQISKGQGDATMERVEFISRLNSLGAPDLSSIIGALPGAARYTLADNIPGQVSQLIVWAEGATGPGVSTVYATAHRLFPNVFPP